MTSLELRPDFSKRKFPRLFLAAREVIPAALLDAFVIWPDRTKSLILDLSEAGLVVPASGVLGQVKLGQTFEAKIQIAGHEPTGTQVKVLRMTAQTVLFSLESLSALGRLKIGQEERENLIRRSWRPLPTLSLHPSFHAAQWWHAPFDTNLWIWRDPVSKAVTKVVLEFESVSLLQDDSGSRFVKSPPAFDEVKGYVGPLIEPLSHKVEPGHNWSDRLQKVMSGSVLPVEALEAVRAVLPRGPLKGVHV